MSKNCINCVESVRTGLDLLCDDCRARSFAIKAVQHPELLESLGTEIPAHVVAQMLALIRERDALKQELALTIAANHALTLLLPK